MQLTSVLEPRKCQELKQWLYIYVERPLPEAARENSCKWFSLSLQSGTPSCCDTRASWPRCLRWLGTDHHTAEEGHWEEDCPQAYVDMPQAKRRGDLCQTSCWCRCISSLGC